VPPGSDSLLLACTFVDQKFDDRVPPNGRLVRAFFGGKAAERLMRCGNDETAAVARLELARILGPLPEPQITVVRRWPRSLPQYAVGHLERMKILDQRVRELRGLWLLGNGYRGVGVPDLVRDARSAARQVVDKH
jgi:oxygen-dependent protoporphyrinogen oxidase